MSLQRHDPLTLPSPPRGRGGLGWGRGQSVETKFRKGETMRIAAIAAVLASVALPAAAQDFYKGKTIDIIVGYTVDNSFDTYARMMARVMPRYLPGSPNMVVQNMPGAGSMRATNHLYNIAAKDGT